MKLTEARVLITGAAGGIGSAVARLLGRSGAALLLTDRAQAPLERLRAELGERGVTAAAETLNLASAADRRTLVARADALGANVLINIAGVNPFGMFQSQSEDDISATIETNTVAPMLLCRAMMPVLAESPAAHIVIVGSTFGSIAYPGFTTYSASKFAIRGFSEALRRELGDTGIRVHYVAPRATRTALTTQRIRAMNEELGIGMDAPETVAASIERILRTERREHLLGRPERLFAKVNGLLPGLVDRAIVRQLPIIRRYAADDRAGVPAIATLTNRTIQE